MAHWGRERVKVEEKPQRLKDTKQRTLKGQANPGRKQVLVKKTQQTEPQRPARPAQLSTGYLPSCSRRAAGSWGGKRGRGLGLGQTSGAAAQCWAYTWPGWGLRRQEGCFLHHTVSLAQAYKHLVRKTVKSTLLP